MLTNNDKEIVKITYVNHQWLIQIGQKIFTIEKLGQNSKITAFSFVSDFEKLKAHVKELSLLKNIVNQSAPIKTEKYEQIAKTTTAKREIEAVVPASVQLELKPQFKIDQIPEVNEDQQEIKYKEIHVSKGQNFIEIEQVSDWHDRIKDYSNEVKGYYKLMIGKIDEFKTML